MQITILSPGEMGAAVGAALAEVGHDVGWLPAGRGPQTRERAELAGLVGRESVEGADLVLSICPPAAALDTARSAVGCTGWFVDANAVSPGTAAAVAGVVTAGGASYVDGGIIGSPPVAAGTTRLYLSGLGAAEVAAVFAGSRVDARPLDGPPYAASSLKMTYAAWTKISGALLVATRAAAAAEGVEEALAAEWALSQPGLDSRWRGATTSAVQKGWRWEHEMLEIADTFAATGQPEAFGQAAAELFARYERPAD
jgi:3-hydroxyisobutyrate dehydrogenase-like beta-hydroxyacid dehydrogenase